MKYYNIRTLEGDNIEISEYDIKHIKVVKEKGKYVIHLLENIINIDASVFRTLKFIYPYIKVVEIK